MPNPLSRVRPNAHFWLNELALRQRPELAADVMQVISVWAFIDIELAGLMTNFLKADFKAVSAMLAALTGGEAKKAVLLAAAKEATKGFDDEYQLLEDVLRKMQPSRSTRNDFAHKLWATSEDLPDALLLVEPSEIANINDSMAELVAGHWRTTTGSYPIPRWNTENFAVYTKADLQREIMAADRASAMVSHLSNALGPPDPGSDAAWLALSLALGDGPSPPRRFRTRKA